MRPANRARRAIKTQKSVRQILINICIAWDSRRKRRASQNNFAGRFFVCNACWPYPRHNPMVAAWRRRGRHAQWSTCLAHRYHVRHCAVPTVPSRIGQHIEDEPCAKYRALLGVFSSRAFHGAFLKRFSMAPDLVVNLFFVLPLV